MCVVCIERRVRRLVQDMKREVPNHPGVYEWAALPPGGQEPAELVCFYVGKSGCHGSGSEQTLASRFLQCVFLLY